MCSYLLLPPLSTTIPKPLAFPFPTVEPKRPVMHLASFVGRQEVTCRLPIIQCAFSEKEALRADGFNCTLSVCLSVCMFVCLSVCLSACMQVCLRLSVNNWSSTVYVRMIQHPYTSRAFSLDEYYYFRQASVYLIVCVNIYIYTCMCIYVCTSSRWNGRL